MKRITLAAFIALSTITITHAQPTGANITWDRIYGSGGDDFGGSVCSDGSGGYVFAGTTNYSGGMVPAAYGINDVAVVHYDANGDILWSKAYGSIGLEAPSAIVKVADGYAIVGSSSSALPFLSGGTLKSSYKGGISDMLVMKIDNSGNTVWYGHYGGVKEDIATDCMDGGDGNLIVAGHSKSGSGDFYGLNHGNYDMAILRINLSTGIVTNAFEFGGSDEDKVLAIEKGEGSEIIFTGYTMSADGDLSSSAAHGDADILCISMDNTLSTVNHILRMGGSGADYSTDVVNTGSGFVIAGMTSSGDFAGPINEIGGDLFVSTLSPDLTVSATALFGGDSDEFGSKLAFRNMTTGGQNIILGAYSYSSEINGAVNHGESDMLIMSMDYPDLTERYTRYFGSNNEDRFVGVLASAIDDSYIVYGSTSGYPIAGGPNGNVTYKRTSVITADIPFEDMWMFKVDDTYSYYADSDADGFGNAYLGISSSSHTAPAGYSADKTDCNDAVPAIHPGAAEICNMFDDNCNGLTDDADPLASGQPVWYADADADGYGSETITQSACLQPSGYISDFTDCLDNDAAVNPAAIETCNGADDNCNGLTDDGALMPEWYADADNDGYGDNSVAVSDCNMPSGFTADNTDCDDADGMIFPLASETCNGADDNCNGLIDDVINAMISPAEVSICKGETAVLTATEGSGYSYIWTRDGNQMAVHTASISTQKAGIYTVTITGPGGCSDISDAVNLVANPAPKASLQNPGSTDLCLLGYVKLKAKVGAGNSCQWYKDGVELNGYTETNYAFSNAGTYQFMETTAAGCYKMSSSVTLFNSCRISDIDITDVYPNPSDGNFMLHVNGKAEESNVVITVSDITGNTVYNSTLHINANENADAEIHLGDAVANGIYILTVKTDLHTFVQRIVVSR